MEFSIKREARAETLTGGCLAIGVYAANKLTPSAQSVDLASSGTITRILERGDLQVKLGQTLMLHNVVGVACERVLLVSLGEAPLDAFAFAKVQRAAMLAVRESATQTLVSTLLETAPAKLGAKDCAAIVAQASWDVLYQFAAPKQSRVDKVFKEMTLLVPPETDLEAVNQGLQYGQAVAMGMSLAKDLGNLPPNICTPTYLANTACQLAQQHSLQVEVLEREALQELGMGAFLAVAQGSETPPKFIILQYQGGHSTQKPVVLVGKGITFDTGGISIKPAADMDEMKYDMCGAASVLGTLKTIAILGLPLNVVGLIPTCENMPDGRATRPGDVVTSLSGQSIEILNTDAEGRLILCDALSYAERFDPVAVIDIATLTGACVIALGHHASGLFSNQDDLARALVQAGEIAQDRAWQLPLWEDYQPQLDSNFADMANVGGRAAGSITAACFLARFTKKYPWAHLDIAGTAWKSGKEKGSTGRPVPLLSAFLAQRANDQN